MKTITEKEFDKCRADLAEVLGVELCVHDDGDLRIIYSGGNIITTVKIKRELKPLPRGTVFNGAHHDGLIACGRTYDSGQFEKALDRIGHTQKVLLDSIAVVSYPGEEAEAWKRVAIEFRYIAKCERTVGGMAIPCVDTVFKRRLKEIRAENDAKYGYPRAEVRK